ncbi:hypothetical protein M3J09_011826 [Ascochyta lentis]
MVMGEDGGCVGSAHEWVICAPTGCRCFKVMQRRRPPGRDPGSPWHHGEAGGGGAAAWQRWNSWRRVVVVSVRQWCGGPKVRPGGGR